MSGAGFLVDGGFRGNPYRLEPDYSRPRLRLDDTMRGALQEIREIRDRYGIEDLRTAAFALAIEKVAVSYEFLGIFP